MFPHAFVRVHTQTHTHTSNQSCYLFGLVLMLFSYMLDIATGYNVLAPSPIFVCLVFLSFFEIYLG
jgi:hypothetical protein